MSAPTDKEMELLRLVAGNGGAMNHEETELSEFCDDNAEPCDVFNACHYKGWLRSAHDFWTDNSTVHLTDAGKARVFDATVSAYKKGPPCSS